MKRIIREVITLIRIERWLVQDEKPLEDNVSSEETAEHLLEEAVIELPASDKPEIRDDNLQVIAQRILDSQQWERSEDGAFFIKHLPNDFQTIKEVE